MKNTPEFQVEFVETSINMVSTWLRNTWYKNFPSEHRKVPSFVLVRNHDDLRTLNEKEGDVDYPFSTLMLTNIGPDPDQAGFGQRFKSVVTGRTENSDRAEISNNIPARVGMGLTFRTDQLDEVISLSHILMFAAPKTALRLSNNFGFVFNIVINIDADLSIPGADMGHPAKEFRFETSLFIQTYVMRTRSQGVIREVVLDVIDSGGVTTIGSFPTLESLGEISLKAEDILNTDSVYYKRQ